MNCGVTEAKMAHKNQKKQQQKFNKKQQLVQQNQKQQQQQHQQLLQEQQNLIKDQNENVTIAPSSTLTSPATAAITTAAINNGKIIEANVLSNSKMISTNLCNNKNNSNNNNNNNSNNNNYNINNNKYQKNLFKDHSTNNRNNNNISQKLKEYYHQQQQQRQKQQQQQQQHYQQQLMSRTIPIMQQQQTNMPKFERSSSFSLKGKLTKLINSITSSKENLHKHIDETQALPTQFTRSRSLILPRRTNRRSLIEPQLEQLTEEAEKSMDPMSPTATRRNSRDDGVKNEIKLVATTTATATTSITVAAATTAAKNHEILEIRSRSQPIEIPTKQNEHYNTSTPIIHRKMSTMATPTYDPQAQFKKRRSNTLITSFRNTFSGLTGLNGGDKKKDKLNPKWSASLQSLQAIDNMISYENMSFIDYDKFNGYEKQLERELSQYSLMDPILNSSLQCIDSFPINEQLVENHMNGSTSSPVTPINNGSILNTPFVTPQTVVRRRRSRSKMETAPSTSNSSPTATGVTHYNSNRKLNERPHLHHSLSRNSFNLDTDYEHNLDKPRNVYRDSLDSRKLELLNAISRSSYTLQDSDVIDVLDLAVATYSKRRKYFKRSHHRKRHGQQNYIKRNATDAFTVDAKNAANIQLKSKSLTHLDGLQTEMICNHAKNTNNICNSEYFSVRFCTESGCQDEEFFPITKGVTLTNALSQALRRRNLSLSKLIITDTNDNNKNTNILEAGSTNIYKTLDENTYVECLAGHHLIISDKEGSRKTLQKANSFSSRVRPPRLLSSASTDDSCDPNLTSNKQIKQRWSGLFGVKNPQQAQLCELLNNYTKNGVPQKTTTTYNFDHPEQEDAINYLDHINKSWKDIVDYSNMTDADLRIQTAIWELVTTEVDYIHCLQTVTDLFLACLEAIQSEGLLQDIDQYRLFANIRDICEANLKFWTFYLYPMVSHSIISHEHLHISFFQTGFVQFGQIFAPYKKYCAEQSSCQFYCKELNRTNSLFTSYLAWCESQKMCNRLRLADILVRPMQRLTKYSLLLAAIKKHLTNVEEIEAIDLMLHTTENFVFSVNNHLTTRQENERLKGVMARIESYDVVDTNNEQLERLIKQNSQMFDLCGPMKGCAPHHVRHLFMEGDHKYKDNHGKIDVHCFLLTDMLLVCKSIAKKGLGSLKIIRQPYLTDRLVVQHSHNVLLCVYLNEFQVATTAFSLHCNEAKNWYDAMKRAKMIYTRLKQCSLTNWDNNNLRYGGGGSIISGGTLDSLGIKKSPMNSSICSHVTSANNSHSGSIEWNDSRIVSADFEKTNSLSSDEGCSYLGVHGFPVKVKPLTTTSSQKLKVNPTSLANSLTVQTTNHLGQSLPNLTLHHSQTNLYHTYSNNTLAVPVSSGTTNHSGTLLLSASHRGISYPPPSPTRVPLRRAMAFSSSIKNPPLLKSRNITSQSSINWHQIPATPTPTTTPQNTLINQAISSNTITTNIQTITTTNISTTTTTTNANTNAATCYALVPTAFYTQSNVNQNILQSNTNTTTLNDMISLSLCEDAENVSLADSTDI